MNEKLNGKVYAKELERLHVELVKLQEWVKYKGLKICIVFEGRDGAGKGGAIKAITERVSPRVFRLIALPAPSDREKSQTYGQRFLPHLQAAGEVVIWDRSWYNRAGVERVVHDELVIACRPEEAPEHARVLESAMQIAFCEICPDLGPFAKVDLTWPLARWGRVTGLDGQILVDNPVLE